MTERSMTEHLARPIVDDTALIEQITWLWQAATGAD